MKSVTELVTGEPAAGVPSSAEFNETQREKVAHAKLKIAFATRTIVPRPTGVAFASPGHAQVQEIFDDGSIRNPYKVNREKSGRQRRKMRKQTNRAMKAKGLQANIADVLKGRRVGTPERPQPATPESPEPATVGIVPPGTVVAVPSGD